MIFNQKREYVDYQCHSPCSFADSIRTQKYIRMNSISPKIPETRPNKLVNLKFKVSGYSYVTTY